MAGMTRIIGMKNKRGQFFAAYLVVLTLFMMGFVIYMYYTQSSAVANTIVSPVTVLDTADTKQLFEMQEKNMILAAAGELSRNNWDKQSFADAAKEGFMDLFVSGDYGWMRDFLFEGIVLNGKEIPRGALTTAESQKNMLRQIYDLKFADGKLQVTRNAVVKQALLQAAYTGSGVKKFDMAFEWEHKAQYLIPESDIKFGTIPA